MFIINFCTLSLLRHFYYITNRKFFSQGHSYMIQIHAFLYENTPLKLKGYIKLKLKGYIKAKTKRSSCKNTHNTDICYLYRKQR